MTTAIIPRYFKENEQLKDLASQKAFGVEFRFDSDVKNYNIIATSHVLVFVLKGEKVMHRESEDLIIKAGEWVFIPKGCYVSSELKNKDNECRRLVLFFEDSFLKEFLNSINSYNDFKKNSDDFVTGPIFPLLKNTIDSLRAYINDDLIYKDSLMRNKLYEILFNILEQDSDHQFISILKKVLISPKIDLKNFMSENFTKPLSITEFAELSCRSVRQFNRDFNNLLNESPNRWIKNRRLEYAHQLLNNTNRSISDICYDCGFKNYSNFIQNFRQKYNITPKRLRA